MNLKKIVLNIKYYALSHGKFSKHQIMFLLFFSFGCHSLETNKMCNNGSFWGNFGMIPFVVMTVSSYQKLTIKK